TIVILEDHSLGKRMNEEYDFNKISLLSGECHRINISLSIGVSSDAVQSLSLNKIQTPSKYPTSINNI
ncbi:MAG TPA: hypothetical protein VHQ70_04170, partial [Syntrophomonadaceae bacterium]|nr:hypothetical protein [Syntrophomonadaceae bacterium]